MFMIRLLFVLAVLPLLCFSQVNNQWQFAIGPSSMSFPNYEQFEPSMTDPSVRTSLINAYNNLGGLPSLASPSLSDCVINELWLTSSSSSQVWSCRCPYNYLPNELVLLAPPPNLPLCYGELTASIVGDKFATSNGSLALFRSAVPYGCDPQCLLHGVCQQTPGECVCPLPANASSSMTWKGQQCQILVPPVGFNAYFTTLTWAPVASSEMLLFGLDPNSLCTMYVNRMPSEYAYGDYIQVENFNMDTKSLSFDFIGQQAPSQILMQIFIVAPSGTDACCTSQTGGTHTNTVGQLQINNDLPVTLSNYMCFILPPQ